MLGWPVKIYDGAWIEWGQMATNDSAIDGSLDPDSPWRTDNGDHTESLTYNKTVVEPVGANSYAPHANLINTEDAGTAQSRRQRRRIGRRQQSSLMPRDTTKSVAELT